MNQSDLIRMIRLHADGELPPEQSAALQHALEQDSEAAEQLARERVLRERVAAVMCSDAQTAPASLRQHIVAALVAEQTGAHAHSDVPEAAADDPAQPDVVGRIDPTAAPPAAPPATHAAPHHQRQSFIARHSRTNFLAVAATLALISGVVLYGIFGTTIDDVTSRSAATEMVADAATFADGEHRVCSDSSCDLNSKLISHSLQSASMNLSTLLREPVEVVDLTEAGYEFLGACPCSMPLPGPSAHLVYRKIAPEGERRPMASVFLVPERGACERVCSSMTPGEWYPAGTAGKCANTVICATDGRMLYFVVCCDDRDLQAVSRMIASR